MGKARRKDKDAATPTQEESKLYLEQAVLECSIPEHRLKEAINLPSGIEYNEWLASHTIAFFDHTNLIYGTVSEFCTMSGCPDMNGPNGRQYLWFDEKGKKCKVAAPQYIDCVMTFTQRTLHDECIFPTKFDHDFPGSFESIVKKIMRLLFHVVAHIYHVHFKEIVLLNMHAHLNALFAHFMLFNAQFNMVEERETEILRDLAVALQLFDGNLGISSELDEKCKVTVSSAAATTSSTDAASAVIECDAGEDVKKDCCISLQSSDISKRPTAVSQSSQSLHSRSSSAGSGSCAMDYCSTTQPDSNFSSSPLKF